MKVKITLVQLSKSFSSVSCLVVIADNGLQLPEVREFEDEINLKNEVRIIKKLSLGEECPPFG